MACVWIGRFDDVGGDDTLLIEGNHVGLNSLMGVIQQLQRSTHPVRLDEHPDVVVHRGLKVSLEIVPEDRGLVVLGTHDLHWRRSYDGWLDIPEKLRALEAAVTPGHHYLDGPTDDLQVVAAVDEHGEGWWSSHAG